MIAAADWTKAVAIRHILLPLDGSPIAEQMIEPAREMAKTMGADITLLRIVQPIPVLEPAPIEMGALPAYDVMVQKIDNMQQSLMQQARTYLEAVAARLKPDVKTVQVQVVEDLPADEILRQALPARTDMVALATHGRRGVSRMLLGSVADKVIRGAHVPVLVLRPKNA